MVFHIKQMYEAWCNGRDASDIEQNIRVFIRMASRNLNMYELEMEEYLRDQDWFVGNK